MWAAGPWQGANEDFQEVYSVIEYAIGGMVSPALDDEIRQAAEGVGAAVAIKDGHLIVYVHDDAADTSALEAILRGSGLSYDRCCTHVLLCVSPCDLTPAEEGVTYFRPGMEEPLVVNDPVYKGKMVPLRVVEEAMGGVKDWAQFIDALWKIREAARPPVEPLPEYVVEES